MLLSFTKYNPIDKNHGRVEGKASKAANIYKTELSHDYHDTYVIEDVIRS